jgi:predicted nucleic acid-binding protein
MARVVIADAGPLIAFASAELLSLLQALFGQVAITEAVRAECAAKPGKDAQAIVDAIAAGWMEVRSARTFGTQTLSPSLGAGESASIRLALEQPRDSLLILDDRIARRYALKAGLAVVGTVRLLDIAQRRGLIDEAAAVIERMPDMGYRISALLLAHIRT